MKNSKLKYCFLLAALASLCALPANAAETSSTGVKAEAEEEALRLEEDFDKALAAAKKDGKKIVLEFSGLDWCPPCKMMHKFVVNTKDFIKYANQKLHFIIADFDRYGKPKNKAFAKQYKKLADQFGLRGFPTIVILSPNGEVQETIVGLSVRSPQELIERISNAK